jgi:Fe-S-cluster-containing hydrogenase component 2/CRP-like cAMP-binding protein
MRAEEAGAGSKPERRPIVRTFARWALRRRAERVLAHPLPVEAGEGGGRDRPVAKIDASKDRIGRFMGLTGALWNVPRSATLVARPDAQGRPCELLLVKRAILLKLVDQSGELRQRSTSSFLRDELPNHLVENRLFRDTFSEGDVADWPGLVALLRGEGGSRPPAVVGRLRQGLGPEFRDWIDRLPPRDSGPDDRERYHILSGLNALLKRDDLFPEDDPPSPSAEVDRLRRDNERSESAAIWSNQRIIERALGGVLVGRPERDRWPLTVEDFRALIEAIGSHEGATVALRHYDKGARVYEAGQESAELFLIVSGTVRITKPRPGGEVLVNQLERHGFFGISCLEAGARHSATVTAVTDVNAVALDRGAVRCLVDRYPALGRKIEGELRRMEVRDRLLETLDRLPPAEPPEEVVSKLLVATNLLRIDMDRCTRCDQCVRACAATHDGVSRFVRSRPDQRFGRWEVAGACVHCSDAPCQSACPAGAITFLDDGSVHVHRSRCIGCKLCVPACPFDVIAMTLPPTPRDIAPEPESKLVATKCDLCLSDRGDPPCVASCPYGAAERGRPRDLFPEIKGWAENLSTR